MTARPTLIAQLTDLHVKLPGRLAYRRVDTAAMLGEAVRCINALDPLPDAVVITGDLTDIGTPEEYAWLRQLLAPLRPPVFVVPGNHDEREAMRVAFADGGYFPDEGFLQYAVPCGGLRLIGLDTLLPGQGGGRLCAERLAWLDAALSAGPEIPALLLMHHPPFDCGIGHMDRLGLEGRAAFVDVVSRHPQVRGVLCGHLHRTVQTMIGVCPAMSAPGPAHQVVLDLRDDAPSRFCMEPPGFMLHRWSNGGLTTHVAAIGRFAGPFPFFHTDGSLID